MHLCKSEWARQGRYADEWEGLEGNINHCVHVREIIKRDAGRREIRERAIISISRDTGWMIVTQLGRISRFAISRPAA